MDVFSPKVFEDFIDEMNQIADITEYRIAYEYTNEMDKYLEKMYMTPSNKTTLMIEGVASNDGIGNAIKKFFVSLITAIQRWADSISNGIATKGREISYRKNLRNIENRLLEAKKSGYTGKVTITDHDTILREYKARYKKLSEFGKRFAKMSYNSTDEIDKDIENFRDLLREFERDLDEIEKKTITVSLSEAIAIVQKELSGNSSYLNSINELKHDIAELEKEALILQKKSDILGAGVIPKHIGFIRNTAANLSKFTRKWIGKFIAKFVFIFA